MKKLLLIALVLMNFMFVKAQNYDTLYIQGMANFARYHYCVNEYDGVVVYSEPNWTGEWTINGGAPFLANHIELSSTGTDFLYNVTYHAGVNRQFYVFFNTQLSESPFAEPLVWKRQGETITLTVDNGNFDPYDYEWLWSNGSDELNIDVTVPGTYSVTATSLYGCGSNTFSIPVRDNVEIESASVDPESNKNLVTWKVTPAQAEYISNVIINRDGVDLVTVPYINGQYLDNIGSDLAARIYTVTGISVEGTPCPIPSLERGTIHMAFLPDINGNVEMTWNSPELGGANIHVGRYEICEYDPNGKGGITVIDFVGPSTMSYSCNQSMFDYGYPLIRAIIQDGRGEKDMLSNRTEEIVGLGEKENKFFNLYPNPTTGRVTIEGTGRLTITNTLGQTILTRDITDTETIDLPMGVWFVKLNETTRKVVVE